MRSEGLKFGSGPRELSGSVDLINHCKLWPHHEFFCKSSLPLTISETHYLRNVVGDRQIRKGDGMELDQCSQHTTFLKEKSGCINPFRLDVLANVFHLQETTAASLPFPDRGTPAAVTKLKSKPKEKQHKHKDRDREKNKDKKKRKHRTKDTNGKEVAESNKVGPMNNGSVHTMNQEKKRRTMGMGGNHFVLKGNK